MTPVFILVATMLQQAGLVAGHDGAGATTATTSGQTILTFSRALNTCDAYDMVIARGTMRVIYAYNTDAAPASLTTPPQYHTTRGAKSMQLVELPEPSPGLPADTVITDVTMEDVHVSDGRLFGFHDSRTTYWCKAITLPATSQKQHIIRADPVITPTSLGKAHHMLLYECTGNLTDPSEASFSGSCEDDSMPEVLQNCRGAKPMATWAIGGSGFEWPIEAGYPLGGEDGPRYAVLEMHYDNHDNVPFVDSSGVRLYHTPTLRPYDAGILYTGYAVSPYMRIPPRQSQFEVTAQCPSGCSQSFLPDGGINIFSAMLHMHTAGRRISTKIVRNGTVTTTFEEPFYDFAFQETMVLPRPFVQYLPGDMMNTVCTYDTSERSTVTVGGLSSNFEMCLSFFGYYPKIPDYAGMCVQAHFNASTFAMVPQTKPGAVGAAWCDMIEMTDPDPDMYEEPPPPCVRVDPAALASEFLNNSAVANNNNNGGGGGGEFILTNSSTSTSTSSNGAIVLPISEFNASWYEYSQLLDPFGNYRLHWKMDPDTQQIHFAAEVNTTGWVGLGFSTTGGMRGADIVMGWASNNVAYVTDRYASTEMLPSVDALQDIYDVVIYQSLPTYVPPAPAINERITLTWSLADAADANSPLLFSVKFQDETAWFAIGFSDTGHMTPSTAIIARSDAPPAQYNIRAHSSDNIVEHTATEGRVRDIAVTYSGGVRELTFVVDQDDAPMYFRKGPGLSTNVIYAYGPSSGAWQQHVKSGGVAVDFAAITDSEEGSASLVLNPDGTGEATITADRARLMFIGHGVLAFLSMLVILPTGVLMRFVVGNQAKGHRAHVVIQVIGFGVALAALAMAILTMRAFKPGESFTKLHHRLGLAVVCACALQMSAFLRPHKQPDATRETTPLIRRIFERVHRTCGRFIIVGAAINCVFGVAMPILGIPYTMVAQGAIVVWGAAVMFGLTVLSVRRSREIKATSFSLQPDEREVGGYESEDDGRL